jgi:hypothetical protein
MRQIHNKTSRHHVVIYDPLNASIIKLAAQEHLSYSKMLNYLVDLGLHHIHYLHNCDFLIDEVRKHGSRKNKN